MVEIKIVSHREYKQQLLDLFNMVFKRNRGDEYWDWKYLNTPVSEPDPQIIVAMDNGKIVGYRAAMDFDMWVNGKKTRAVQTCDGMVHQDYRRQGIFDKIVEAGIEYYQERAAFFYNFPNDKALPSNLRHGWKIIGERELLFYPINTEKLVARFISNKLIAKIGSFVYKLILGPRPKIRDYQYEIKVYSEYNEKLNTVEEIMDKSKINLSRSREFFKWRIDQHPFNTYKYLVATLEDKLQGYMIISKQNTSGINEGKIIDFIVKDEDLECFRELVVKSMEELTDCDIISVWAFNQENYREELLTRLKFKSSQNYPYNRLRDDSKFVARELNTSKTNSLNIYDSKNWQLTLIYPDTF